MAELQVFGPVVIDKLRDIKHPWRDGVEICEVDDVVADLRKILQFQGNAAIEVLVGVCVSLQNPLAVKHRVSAPVLGEGLRIGELHLVMPKPPFKAGRIDVFHAGTAVEVLSGIVLAVFAQGRKLFLRQVL